MGEDEPGLARLDCHNHDLGFVQVEGPSAPVAGGPAPHADHRHAREPELQPEFRPDEPALAHR